MPRGAGGSGGPDGAAGAGARASRLTPVRLQARRQDDTMAAGGGPLVPDSVLLEIFLYLEPADVLSAGRACRQWHAVARDEFLWKELFYRYYGVSRDVPRHPGARGCSGVGNPPPRGLAAAPCVSPGVAEPLSCPTVTGVGGDVCVKGLRTARTFLRGASNGSKCFDFLFVSPKAAFPALTAGAPVAAAQRVWCCCCDPEEPR